LAVRAREIGEVRSGALLLSELTWMLGTPGAPRTLLVGHRAPRAAEPEVLAFSLMPLGAGDVLARAEAMPPVAARDALTGTLRAVRAVQQMGLDATPLPALEAAGQAAAAARRSRDLGIGLDPEGCIVVATLLRALGQEDVSELPRRLAVLPRWDVDAPPGTDEEAQEGDELVGELIAWCERAAASDAQLGAAACLADAMVRHAAERRAGALHGWSAGDLEDFLLGWLPGSLPVAAEHVSLVPGAVATVLRFLGESGRMPRARAEGLAARAFELGPAYARACASP
jgi:hypothetical protein